MKTILDYNKNYGVDMEFTFDGTTILNTYTDGDEDEKTLKCLFDLLVKHEYIPKDKKGVCSLFDFGEVTEDGVRLVDIYFYYDGVLDEENTPILELTDEFIDELKSMVG